LLALALACAACASPYGERIRVIIPHGSTFSAAADSLASHDILISSRAFRLYVSTLGRDRTLKPGTYEFQRGTAWSKILDDLTAGRGIVHTFTIPEGFAISSIAPLLSRMLEVPPESVSAAVSDTALLHQLDVPTATLEGYLFPDTYTFPAGTSARDAVAFLVRRFEQAWKPEWNAQLDRLTMSRHDVITLASIIEKEAKLPEERAVISAVYHNRLKARMLLQADPTVQYALGTHVTRVLYKHLEVDSKYNTYRFLGLPPGPIASPGAPSIEAALFPADVPYRYFVAHPDGHHEFRRTFAEHSQAISEVRRQPSGER
jgi:UPF0755 protein